MSLLPKISPLRREPGFLGSSFSSGELFVNSKPLKKKVKRNGLKNEKRNKVTKRRS